MKKLLFLLSLLLTACVNTEALPDLPEVPEVSLVEGRQKTVINGEAVYRPLEKAEIKHLEWETAKNASYRGYLKAQEQQENYPIRDEVKEDYYKYY